MIRATQGKAKANEKSSVAAKQVECETWEYRIAHEAECHGYCSLI